MNKSKYYLVVLRRLVQTLFVLLLICIVWATKYPLKDYINPEYYFYIDPLVMIVSSVAGKVLIYGLVFSIFVLILSFLLGRVFCGWVCPLGAISDLWVFLIRTVLKLRTRNSEPSKIRNFKYGLLIVIFMFAILGLQIAWIFDPITIFVRTFVFNIHPAINNTVDKMFIFMLQKTNYFEPVETIYSALKNNVLCVSQPVFRNTTFVAIIFVLILSSGLIKKRFWCRYICPLGALLSIPAKFTIFRRAVYSCKDGCSLCKNICRMNAIRSDNSYLTDECILCLDCISFCPQQNTIFKFTGLIKHNDSKQVNEPDTTVKNTDTENTGITRAQFLLYVVGSISLFVGFKNKKNIYKRVVIRPPGSLPEQEFVQRCIRCGNCMKVCPTNVLQPALFETGLQGLWTPRFDTEIGYCEYKCNLCGEVCPTAAIEKLTVEEKMQTRTGVAEINTEICIPWTTGEQCIVCEEHCPVSGKAIKTIEKINKKGKLVKLPYVDDTLCVGCALCEHKCPTRPYRAIKVKP